MSIEIKITGTHATDLAAQIETLAQMFGIIGQSNQKLASAVQVSTVDTKESSTPTIGTEAKKTLSRKEQDEAAAEMIEKGAKDARFDLLTKGRQNEVEGLLNKPVTQAATSDVDSMFDDAPATRVVTRDMVSKLMGDVCKKPDGTAIQARALKVREILVDNIPDGEEIKVKFIKEDRLAAVYDAIAQVAQKIPAE